MDNTQSQNLTLSNIPKGIFSNGLTGFQDNSTDTLPKVNIQTTTPITQIIPDNPTNQSTTTLSNSNKMQQVPSIIAKTNQLSQTGITTNSEGTPTYSNGTIVPEPQPVPPPDVRQGAPTSNVIGTPLNSTSQGGYYGETYIAPGTQIPTDSNGNPVQLTQSSPASDTIIGNLNQLKSQSDALTASTVDNIKSQYDSLIQQQQQANNAQQGIVQNALLMGGVTSKGSSAQYAPISSSGIVSAQLNYGIQQIQNLQAQEQQKIIEAQQAGQNQDFQLQDKINSQISNIRDEKIQAANKVNDQIAVQNQKLKDQNLQFAKDVAVANLYSSGITDPSKILSQLKTQGITNITSTDVSNTIKNIANKSGVDVSSLDTISKEFFALKDLPNGLPASITSLPDTASQLAAFVKMYNQASQAGTTLGTQAILPISGAGSGAINVARIAGITDTTIPLTQAISSVGIDSIVKGIIANEGGSPTGVINNPGNIKYVGSIGQIDSGVKATDGGTFASYKTPADGNKDIATIVQNAASGNSSAYGSNPTFEQFMNKYTNTAPNNTAPGTTGSPQIDSTVSGYSSSPLSTAGGLTQAAVDKAALSYAMTGTMPSVGLGSTGAATLKRNAIQNRAAELDSNGQISSNKAQLSALTTSLGQQTTYQNTIQRSVNTVDDNLKLLEDAANKVNKLTSPLINQWYNLAKSNVIGSGDVASYKAAIQTVRSEYANILARGGQVTDTTRSESAKLIPDNITKDQLNKVIDTLRAEGKNVLDNANKQVSSVQSDINNIIGGGNLYKTPQSGSLVSGTTHNGYDIPIASGGNYKIGNYSLNIPTS